MEAKLGLSYFISVFCRGPSPNPYVQGAGHRPSDRSGGRCARGHGVYRETADACQAGAGVINGFF